MPYPRWPPKIGRSQQKPRSKVYHDSAEPYRKKAFNSSNMDANCTACTSLTAIQ